MIGSQIRQYSIDREIGRGAFGTVFQGHLSHNPQEIVAIKILDDTNQLDRQMAEPELLSRLQHPSIVRQREYFVLHGQLVIVLDFISGGDLKSALEAGRDFTEAEVWELLRSMASALDYAHGRNIVHRDIKMANIMLEESNGSLRFVLTDFGIGRVSEGVQDRPNTGGTYLFMAPEQFRGRPVAQSDLWALGVVAYRLLSGKMPFLGDSLHDLSRSILYANPVAPSVAASKPINEQLDLLVSHLLQKSLNERVGSAEELLRLINDSHGNKPGSGSRLIDTSESIIHAFVGSSDAKNSKDSGMDRLLKRLRRQRKIAFGLSLVFAAAIAFGSGLVGGILTTIGVLCFFKSQQSNKPLDTRRFVLACTCFAAAWGFGAVHVDSETTTSELVDVKTERGGSLAEISLVFLKVFNRISYPLFAIAIASHRRLARKIVNTALLVENQKTDDSYFAKMRASVSERPNNISFRLKYIEALLTAGNLEDVIIECQLVLDIDPYNFNANLLLANALIEVGLFDDAAQVCKHYLSVSGYCFEFQMLLERCISQGACV